MLSSPRFRLPILLSTLLLSAISQAEEAVSLRQIMDRHWEAIGGMRAWSQVESIQLNGTIERDGQTVEIVIVKKQPNQIRATVTLPLPGDPENQIQLIRAHDGKQAWTATRLAGAEDLTREALPPEAANELLVDAGVMPPLLKMWQANVKLELLEPREIGYETAYTIRTLPEAGTRFDFFISSEDFRLIGYETRNDQGHTTRTTLADYTEIEGIQLPATVTIESDDTGTSILRHSSMDVGVGIYREYFELSSGPTTARQ
jgi:outer membrane lipoprotein-sorting protein